MPEASLFVEKRAHPRLSAEIHVRYRLIEDQKEMDSVIELRKREQNTRTSDLSLGGMYIVADRVLSMGTILRLDIFLPGKSLPAFAEVVWANETGAGLHFLAMKESDREFLQAYLNRTSVTP